MIDNCAELTQWWWFQCLMSTAGWFNWLQQILLTVQGYILGTCDLYVGIGIHCFEYLHIYLYICYLVWYICVKKWSHLCHVTSQLYSVSVSYCVMCGSICVSVSSAGCCLGLGCGAAGWRTRSPGSSSSEDAGLRWALLHPHTPTRSQGCSNQL